MDCVCSLIVLPCEFLTGIMCYQNQNDITHPNGHDSHSWDYTRVKKYEQIDEVFKRIENKGYEIIITNGVLRFKKRVPLRYRKGF